MLKNLLKDELLDIAKDLQEKRDLNEKELKETRNNLDNVNGLIIEMDSKKTMENVGIINTIEDEVMELASDLHNHTRNIPAALNKEETQNLKDSLNELIEILK